MNNNVKKNVFNKRNIIIFSCICICIIIAILLVTKKSIISGPKEEVVECSIRKKNIAYDYEINQKVYYVDDIFQKLEFEQVMIFTHEKLKSNIMVIKDELEKNMSNLSNLKSLKYNVEIIEEKIVLNYSLDAVDQKKLEEEMKHENQNLMSTDNIYDSKNRYINSALRSGWECNYE